jgi:hypothetical protein
LADVLHWVRRRASDGATCRSSAQCAISTTSAGGAAVVETVK